MRCLAIRTRHNTALASCATLVTALKGSSMPSFPMSPCSALLARAEGRAPVSSANAAQIGLTPAPATSYTAAVTAYASAFVAQQTAIEAAHVGTKGTRIVRVPLYLFEYRSCHG